MFFRVSIVSKKQVSCPLSSTLLHQLSLSGGLVNSVRSCVSGHSILATSEERRMSQCRGACWWSCCMQPPWHIITFDWHWYESILHLSSASLSSPAHILKQTKINSDWCAMRHGRHEIEESCVCVMCKMVASCVLWWEESLERGVVRCARFKNRKW